MTALNDAIFDLRVRVLSQIARRKQIEFDERTIRALAHNLTDAQVFVELRRMRRPWGRLWNWLARRRQAGNR